ncbi:ABC transporter permease [Paenibacillus thailandensis]|uniref:ABC transporter permease n=1 Tax=Paenibacillus thailandensis TaxID=393250 RepID=A0ABW5QV18_9BACL
MKSALALFKTLQVRIGLVFAIFVPFVFLMIWMTGYDDATERIDRLHVGIVSENPDENGAAVQFLTTHAPFQTELVSSKEEALADMDNGDTDMVVVVPAGLQTAGANGGATLTYYVNDRSSDLTWL